MMDACHMLKLTRNMLQVSLAAQTLSNSVAVALRTLQDVGYAEFKDLHDHHSNLPVCYDGLVDNALVYISGFVVRRALKKLSCDVCRASLVTDAASAIKDQSYHLLCLRNNGGLVIPSEGTVRVVRAAGWVIRQASASLRRSQPFKLLEV
ncbi:unnamed protein product [Gadus morhua 'NCC']